MLVGECVLIVVGFFVFMEFLQTRRPPQHTPNCAGDVASLGRSAAAIYTLDYEHDQHAVVAG